MMKNIGQSEFAFSYTKNYLFPLLIILTVLAVFNAMQLFFFHTSASSFTKLLNIIFSKLIYFWFYLLLIFQLSVYYSRYTNRKQIYWIIYNLWSLVVFVVLHQLLSYSVHVFVLRKKVSKTILEMLIDNQAVYFDVVIYVLFLFLLYLIEFKKIIQEKELRQIELEVELIRTKLSELRVKIQPEFLFSTLDSISGLIKKKKNREANRKLGMLSDFLRTTIYTSFTAETTVSDELKFLKLYMEIEQDAESDTLNITTEIDPKTEDALMPQFTIQQIVEEFVRSSRNCSISFPIFLKVQKLGKNIELKIENISPEIKNAVLKSDVMKYIQEQFEKLYGDSYSFSNTGKEKEEIAITFPYKQKELSFKLIPGIPK